MAKVIKTTFLLRRGTAAQWEEQNIILQRGEPGFAWDIGVLKIGDGETPWSGLDAVSTEFVVDRPTHYDFPTIGNPAVIYKAHEEGKLYQWNSAQLKYEPIVVDVSPESLNIKMICGGSASDTIT